jgi:putative hydrolase of the HAD superfamily
MLRFDAVAFDIDGTLYPNYRFYVRAVPSVLAHPLLFWGFVQARNVLHDGREVKSARYYEEQAHLIANSIGKKGHEAITRIRKLVDEKIYNRWNDSFSAIRPYPGVLETLETFRAAGLKLAVLSDFPLGTKLHAMGLEDENGTLWDVKLCAEISGGLKPCQAPFHALQKKLDVPAERILYVGNSRHYDAAGASACGMKTALLGGRKKAKYADFTFKNYGELESWVLTLV